MRNTPATCGRAGTYIRAMEGNASSEEYTSVKSCEYQALKDCLDRNQGRREKCEREWREFQTLCVNNKK